MSLRNSLRKIVPLRASVFAKYREDQRRQQEEVRRQQEADFEQLLQAIDGLGKRVEQLSADLSKAIESNGAKSDALKKDMRDQQKSIERGRDCVVGELRKLTTSQNVIMATGFKTTEAKIDATKQLIYFLGDDSPCENADVELPSYSSETTLADVVPRADARVIVSLTSYPARIRGVGETIKSLISQTRPADSVQLWLAVEQFPLREAELPIDLLALREEGLEIRWCDDIKAHKKYYYAMLENPESIIITADDDVYYDPDAVKILMEAHERFPGTVCTRRARRIEFRDNGEAAAYAKWPLSSRVDEPSMALVATGVGGVLYPPHCMDKLLFDKELLKAACPNSDDLWLKTMQYLAGTETVLADTAFRVNAVGDSQDTALYVVDQATSRNDKDVWAIRCALRDRYPNVWASGMIAEPQADPEAYSGR